MEQCSLFGGEAPALDRDFATLRRRDLGGGAWVDHQPGWLRGHEVLFERLKAGTSWHADRRWMYEREVDVPRLTALLPEDGPGHPVIFEAAALLSARYDAEVRRVSLAWYRDGRDSVAWHGDRGDAALPGALTVSVSLGEPRKFMLRPAGGGASIAWRLGWGDLLVMGGTCQQTWQHAVPKVALAGPRLAVLFWCRQRG